MPFLTDQSIIKYGIFTINLAMESALFVVHKLYCEKPENGLFSKRAGQIFFQRWFKDEFLSSEITQLDDFLNILLLMQWAIHKLKLQHEYFFLAGWWGSDWRFRLKEENLALIIFFLLFWPFTALFVFA